MYVYRSVYICILSVYFNVFIMKYLCTQGNVTIYSVFVHFFLILKVDFGGLQLFFYSTDLRKNSRKVRS